MNSAIATIWIMVLIKFRSISAQSLKCTEDIACTISCNGPKKCYGKVIDASKSISLTVTGSGDSSMGSMVITCPNNGTCQISASGHSSLFHSLISAEQASSLSISAAGKYAFGKTIIHCPTKGGAACNIQFRATSDPGSTPVALDMEIHINQPNKGNDLLQFYCNGPTKAQFIEQAGGVRLYDATEQQSRWQQFWKLDYWILPNANPTISVEGNYALTNTKCKPTTSPPTQTPSELPSSSPTKSPSELPTSTPAKAPSGKPTGQNQVTAGSSNSSKPTVALSANKSSSTTKYFWFILPVLAVVIVAVVAFCVYKYKYSPNQAGTDQSNERRRNDIERASDGNHVDNYRPNDIETGHRERRSLMNAGVGSKKHSRKSRKRRRNKRNNSKKKGRQRIEEDMPSQELQECVELTFETKGKGQDIEIVHEELLEQMMDVPGFKEKIHEQEIEVISEKKGEMTFILKQSADTALDDPAITEVVALLRADKRAKHYDMRGLEEPIKIPKKKKKRRSKKKKSKPKKRKTIR